MEFPTRTKQHAGTLPSTIHNGSNHFYSVLHDWNTGKIKYYCKPPKKYVGSLDENEILSEFSPAFEAADVKVLSQLESDELCDYVPMEDLGGAPGEMGDAQEEVVDADGDEMQSETRSRTSVKRTKKVGSQEDEDQVGRAVNLRKQQRLNKKRETKIQRRGQEAYDFDVDFEEEEEE